MNRSNCVVPIENGINFRDLGGIKNKAGRAIKPRMLFRAGAFADITPQEQDCLSSKIKIKYILDYRSNGEVKANPDLVWDNCHYIHAPANPCYKNVTAALSSDDSDIEAQLNHTLKQTDPHNFMINLYQLLPFDNSGYRELVKLLLDTNGSSIVQHCAIGKDRTGVGVALTLFALDVDEETVMNDYLLTESLLAPYRDKLLSHYAQKLDHEDLAKRREIFTAKREYLHAAIDAIKSKYQSIDDWLFNEYGIDEAKKRIIQNHYLA